MDTYSRGDYSGAIPGFQEFLANYGGHQLADNAQYWIGECYYAQKKYSEAEMEFGKVEKHYRDGNKSAAALLKRGLALKELGRLEEAQVALEKVVSKHSGSEEAAIAESKLSHWR